MVTVGNMLQAALVEPSLVVWKGKITGVDTRRKPARVPVGTFLKFGEDSAGILIPVPGQVVFQDKLTDFHVSSASLDNDPGAPSNITFQGFVERGHVHSSMLHPKQRKSLQEISTPCAIFSGAGKDDASWSTWVGDHQDLAAVYSGSVIVSVRQRKVSFGGASAIAYPVTLTAGQVAILKCGDSRDTPAELVVLDLKTGQTLRYSGGPQPSTGFATGAELLEARNIFASAVDVFQGTASADARIGFALLLTQINSVLNANHIAPIAPNQEWQLFPNWFGLEPTTATDEASSATPPPPPGS
jgi:hypothetical protein